MRFLKLFILIFIAYSGLFLMDRYQEFQYLKESQAVLDDYSFILEPGCVYTAHNRGQVIEALCGDRKFYKRLDAPLNSFKGQMDLIRISYDFKLEIRKNLNH